MTPDEWQTLTGGADINLTRVHIQRGAGLKVSNGNAEVQPIAELYYDCRLSQPRGLNWITLKRAAEARSAALIVTHDGQKYAVTMVDEVPDDRGRPHHYRMEME
jgi:hypothetical protein